MTRRPFSPVAEVTVGASGARAGVTETAVLWLLVPIAFTARSLTWYGVPLVRPGSGNGLAVDAGLRTVQVTPLSTEYSMFETAAPFAAPSEKATDAEASPAVTDEIVGAPATVAGVPLTDVLAAPGPCALTPRTFTGYVTPFERPVMTSGLAVDAGSGVVHVVPPSTECSMFVIADPPSNPAVKFTVSWPFPRTSDPIIGAAGGEAGVNWREEEAGPVPIAFRARMRTSYAVPFERPVTTTGELSPGTVVQVSPSSSE